MAVQAVYALKRNRSGSIELDKYARDYNIAFMVVTNDPADGPQVARTAIDPNGGPVIPQPGTFYVYGNDTDLGCYNDRVDAHEIGDSGLIWEVTCTAKSWNYHVPKPGEDPLTRPPEVSWSFAQFQKVAWKDVVSGKAITNSAGQYFDPPIQIDDSRPLYVCQRNEAAFDPSLAVTYKDAINSDPLMLGGLLVLPGQAKMQNITSHREFDNNSFYWSTTYEIAIKDDCWQEQPMDQGMYQKDGSKCKDKDGDEVVAPVPLDGSGNQLAFPINTSSIVFLDFNVYDALPFSALALP